MDSTTNPAASGANNATDALTTLVLWTATNHPDDARELLEPLGVEQADIDRFAAQNAGVLETIQKMAIAAVLLDRNTLARLIRVRVGVKLIETEDPRQLAPLVNAAAKLPGWVFGEVETSSKPTAARAGQNGVYLDESDGLPDISEQGMADAIAEAKALIEELEKPARVPVDSL